MGLSFDGRHCRECAAGRRRAFFRGTSPFFVAAPRHGCRQIGTRDRIAAAIRHARGNAPCIQWSTHRHCVRGEDDFPKPSFLGHSGPPRGILLFRWLRVGPCKSRPGPGETVRGSGPPTSSERNRNTGGNAFGGTLPSPARASGATLASHRGAHEDRRAGQQALRSTAGPRRVSPLQRRSHRLRPHSVPPRHTPRTGSLACLGERCPSVPRFHAPRRTGFQNQISPTRTPRTKLSTEHWKRAASMHSRIKGPHNHTRAGRHDGLF